MQQSLVFVILLMIFSFEVSAKDAFLFSLKNKVSQGYGAGLVITTTAEKKFNVEYQSFSPSGIEGRFLKALPEKYVDELKGIVGSSDLSLKNWNSDFKCKSDLWILTSPDKKILLCSSTSVAKANLIRTYFNKIFDYLKTLN